MTVNFLDYIVGDWNSILSMPVFITIRNLNKTHTINTARLIVCTADEVTMTYNNV